MNQEQILDALEFIDDDMIESVNVLRKYPDHHKHLWLNYVAVAACVVLAIFGGFKFLGSNAPTQEQSNSNGGTSQTDDVIDMFGDIADTENSNENNKFEDNSSFRDESTGATSGSSSATGDACFAATVYMEITEIGDNSFKGKVLKRAVVGNSTHFEENQVVTVIYSKSTNENLHTLLIEDLSVGEKVYVFYGRIESDTIYTPRIEYELF